MGIKLKHQPSVLISLSLKFMANLSMDTIKKTMGPLTV